MAALRKKDTTSRQASENSTIELLIYWCLYNSGVEEQLRHEVLQKGWLNFGKTFHVLKLNRCFLAYSYNWIALETIFGNDN